MTACSLDDSGRLYGVVAFENLAVVRQSGEALIGAGEGEVVQFDCSGLEEASSVAVALLIAWRRMARGSGKSVVFSGTSLALRNIAAFSGVDEILALET